jgi:hypothetical protein
MKESDDGVKSEDLFRRAAFGWALATKRLVDASRMLSRNSKVVYPALADIEYARELLDKLVLPIAVKVPAPQEDRINALTPQLVRDSVSVLVSKANSALGVEEPKNAQTDAIVVVPEEPQISRGVDLAAPVYPRGSKMLWTTVRCNYCGVEPHQRCKNDDGRFIEKPHPSRKNVAEAARSL